MSLPVQTGVLLPSVKAVGGELTTTVVVATGLVQPLTVMVAEYIPSFASVEDVIVGSSSDEVNPSGPVQEYVPAMVFEVNIMSLPTHTGVLLPRVNAAGVVFTTTVVVATGLVQVPTVTVAE